MAHNSVDVQAAPQQAAPSYEVPSTYVMVEYWERAGTELYLHPGPARSGVLIAMGKDGGYHEALRFQYYSSDGEVYLSDWLGPAEAWDEETRTAVLDEISAAVAEPSP